MKQIRKRLTYANVMSSIAVFLVLGGAAVAATQLPKNSVGSKQLKKNAVVSSKIKKEAVAEAKLKNGAVASGKLADGAVTGQKLADGSVSSGKIADGSVTNSKLANGAATQSKLGTDVVAPRAIAEVGISSEEPFLKASRGSGVISVAQGTIKGFYCFQLEFTPTAMQITDLIKGHFDFGVGEPGAAPFVCPSGTEASVVIVKSETGLADSSPQEFTITFY